MILAGDIGGTKVNLALCEVLGSNIKLHDQRRYASAQFLSLGAVLKQYLSEVPAKYIKAIHFACFGVPGPVINGRCQTINLPWVLDERVIEGELNLCPLKLINDLEATAHGIEILSEGRGLEVLRPASAPATTANRALIAPGTGLGEAMLFWDGTRYVVSPSEGGHADFGPQNEEQIDLLRWLWPRHKHVSFEHVASGPAIYRIFRFLHETGREEAPTELLEQLSVSGIDPSPLITAKAMSGESLICSRALDLWLFCLGAEAGNLALKGLSLGGLYIGGGIVPNILSLFRRPKFLEGFESKGRMGPILKSVPVSMITDENAALYGAALVYSVYK